MTHDRITAFAELLQLAFVVAMFASQVLGVVRKLRLAVLLQIATLLLAVAVIIVSLNVTDKGVIAVLTTFTATFQFFVFLVNTAVFRLTTWAREYLRRNRLIEIPDSMVVPNWGNGGPGTE